MDVVYIWILSSTRYIFILEVHALQIFNYYYDEDDFVFSCCRLGLIEWMNNTLPIKNFLYDAMTDSERQYYAGE